MAKECKHYKNINGGVYAIISPSSTDDTKCSCRLCGNVLDASMSDTLNELAAKNIRKPSELIRYRIGGDFGKIVFDIHRQEYEMVKHLVENSVLKVYSSSLCETYKEHMKPVIESVHRVRRMNGLDE